MADPPTRVRHISLHAAAEAAVLNEDWTGLAGIAALETHPHLSASWRAQALWRQGRLDELVQHLDAVGWDLAFSGRAEALVDLNLHVGQPARALWWLNQTPLGPTAASLATIAVAFAELGQRAAWSWCVDRILDRIRVGDSPTGPRIGDVLARAVSWKRPQCVPLAMARCEAVPHSPWSWWWLGRAHAAVGDRADAQHALRRALDLDPAFEPAHHQSSLVDRVQPDRPTDVSRAEQADVPSEEAEPVVAGIQQMIQRGDYEAALDAGTRLARKAPSAAVFDAIDAARARLNDLQPVRRRVPLARGYRPVAGRIMHVVGQAWPATQSGYTLRTRYVTEVQKRMGLDPFILSGPDVPWRLRPGFHRLQETVNGIPIDRVPAVRPHLERAMAVVRRHRPAVIHAASDFRNALVAIDLGRSFSIPVVYEVRGLWEETWASRHGPAALDRDAYRLRRDIETRCMVEADAVVTLSGTLRDEIVGRGVPHDRITVVPNAVDADRFSRRSRPDDVARRLGIAPEAVVVGCITSVVGYEGLPLLVEAVAALRDEGRQVVGMIVGDGPDRRALEELAESKGLGSAMCFPGAVPHGDIVDYYALLDVFVLPRTNDRVCRLVTPLKPFEAMAMGLPLVVSRLDPLVEIIDEGVSGVSFEPGNGRELTAVLRRLLDDPSLRESMGSNAAAKARSAHTWSVTGERYVQLYEGMGVV